MFVISKTSKSSIIIWVISNKFLILFRFAIDNLRLR
nr:MAG TPA: hypothetical protein [Caudoviricetes sp.]